MNTFEEIIEFAIRQEEAEEQFYLAMAARAENDDVRVVMEQQAAEEREHKGRLQTILAKGKVVVRDNPLNPDMKIADYTSSTGIVMEGLGYRDALILAAKREQAAERLYRDLAARAGDAAVQETLLFLAAQEAKHRHALERDYDDLLGKQG